MFNPPNNLRVGPVTTPVFRSVSLDGNGVPNETFTQYVEEHRAGNPNTIATVGSIILFLANDAVANPQNPTSANSSNAFIHGADAAIIALAAPPAGAPADDNERNIVAAHANLPNVCGWLADLINRAKKKPLSPDNVNGYFAMLSHSGTSGGVVASLINKISVFFPDDIGTAAFRALLTPGVWTTYACSRVSAGAIMFPMLQEFRDLGITANGDAVEAAITAAEADPWNIALATQIPKKFKAYAALYLQAAGTPIDTWIQGNKAIDELPAAKVRGAKEIFRRYLEVKNDVSGLNAINNVAGFIAGVGTFW